MFILSKHTEDHGTGKGDVESQGSFPVQASGLRKSYGNTVALDSIDISVRDGELFGIIGPDGAGKTTLFRILTTLIIADDGKASANGYYVV